MSRLDTIKARLYSRKIIGCTECQIFWTQEQLHPSYPKIHYFRCKPLYSISEFASKTQMTLVDNGQYFSVLFIRPVMIDIHGHRFEIFILV